MPTPPAVRRFDTDGCAYTLQEFVQHYTNAGLIHQDILQKWDNSAIAFEYPADAIVMGPAEIDASPAVRKTKKRTAEKSLKVRGWE